MFIVSATYQIGQLQVLHPGMGRRRIDVIYRSLQILQQQVGKHHLTVLRRDHDHGHNPLISEKILDRDHLVLDSVVIEVERFEKHQLAQYLLSLRPVSARHY